MRGHRDLRLVVALVALCAAGAVMEPLGAARLVFVIPLTLFLPGYAIAAVVFGRRRLDAMTLLPVCAGLSLAALVLTSIVLNYTPSGIQGLPWAIALLLIVVACCRGAALRREPATESPPAFRLPRLRPCPRATLLSVGTLLMVVGALVLAQTTLHAGKAFGYTELWLVPTDQTQPQAEVGVMSEVQHRASYRLEVTVRDGVAPFVREFTLDPAESRSFSIPHTPGTRRAKVEAVLYRRTAPATPYRSVFGWLPAAGEEP